MGLHREKVVARDGDVGHLTVPAMLFIDHPQAGPESHAVALMEADGGQAVFWDPLHGREQRSFEALRAIWHGRAVLCRR